MCWETFPRGGKRLKATLEVVEVMLLFKVTFQQMIDSFVVLQLGIRKKCWRLSKFHITEWKREWWWQNRIDFLNLVRKFSSVRNALKAMKVKATFITSVFFCCINIFLYYWVSYNVFSCSFMFSLISVSWLESDNLFNSVYFLYVCMSRDIWMTLTRLEWH